jgi:hypothetical protein
MTASLQVPFQSLPGLVPPAAGRAGTLPAPTASVPPLALAVHLCMDRHSYPAAHDGTAGENADARFFALSGRAGPIGLHPDARLAAKRPKPSPLTSASLPRSTGSANAADLLPNFRPDPSSRQASGTGASNDGQRGRLRSSSTWRRSISKCRKNEGRS